MTTADVAQMVEYLNENLLLMGEDDQGFVQGVHMLITMDENVTPSDIQKVRALFQQVRSLEIT